MPRRRRRSWRRKPRACNSLGINRRFIDIGRLDRTVRTLGHLNLVRDRRFVRLVEHDTSRRDAAQGRLDEFGIELMQARR